MKNILKAILVTISVFIGLSIIRIKPQQIAYGRFAGECVGNCSPIYKITKEALCVDSTSFSQARYDLGKLQIKGQTISEDKRDLNVKKISIPLIMLLDPRTRFGCPDCHDQGGYYLGYTLFGIRRYFEIDKDSEPIYFHGLTKSIDNKICDIRGELSKFRR